MSRKRKPGWGSAPQPRPSNSSSNNVEPYRRNSNQSLAVVSPKPRTLICYSAWLLSPKQHERAAQNFADEFGVPVTIVTERGRRLAYAEPR